MNFYEAQGKMASLVTGDMAQESLAIAEDQWNQMSEADKWAIENDEPLHASHVSRDIPPGEDMKWMCGDCGATDWTPNNRRCKYCKE